MARSGFIKSTAHARTSLSGARANGNGCVERVTLANVSFGDLSMETIRTRQLEQENNCLRKALSLALKRLIVNEPPDSRAVSDEFVAMACVENGDTSLPVMNIIDAANQQQRPLP
jgi:hypothetical protein